MLLLLGALIGLGAGLLSGGKLANLAALQLRWPYLPIAALAVKEIALVAPFNRMDAAPVAYAISLIALIGWTLWHVKRLPAVWLLTSGMLLNLIPVLANGGRMPVSQELAARGPHILIQQGYAGQYVLMSQRTNFNWLADWVAMPGPLGAVIPEAYSPGDLVAFCGLIAITFLAVRRAPQIAAQAGETSGRIVSDPP